jgi:cellulose synthase/poly-beta-1,6-N-acetylglucosamine synthase-like glycosyltransferase
VSEAHGGETAAEQHVDDRMTRNVGLVSLVATVLNEASTIEEWLASIDGQTVAPDEVVIVDGGSIDGTFERLGAWVEGRPNASVLSLPGASISAGRNHAVRQARGELVAVTDAGVVLQPDWLERLIEGFAPEVDVVSGFFIPDARGVFEWAMGATVLPSVGDVEERSFLPSSRSVAFRRSAWEAAGAYPEWLDYCEDLVLDLKLKEQGAVFAWAPRALVRFRPRGTLRAFFLQYFRYARGDGKADLWKKRHALRYVVYLFAVFALARQNPLAIFAVATGAGLYCRRPAQRLLDSGPQSPAATLAALGLIPVIRLTGDVAKMAGYPVGVMWRWTHRREVDALVAHAN